MGWTGEHPCERLAGQQCGVDLSPWTTSCYRPGSLPTLRCALRWVSAPGVSDNDIVDKTRAGVCWPARSWVRALGGMMELPGGALGYHRPGLVEGGGHVGLCAPPPKTGVLAEFRSCHPLALNLPTVSQDIVKSDPRRPGPPVPGLLSTPPVPSLLLSPTFTLPFHLPECPSPQLCSLHAPCHSLSKRLSAPPGLAIADPPALSRPPTGSLVCALCSSRLAWVSRAQRAVDPKPISADLACRPLQACHHGGGSGGG